MPTANSRLPLYFFVFALSGGAGLIYESIWTHYLKLFLGHAAYAQTLVLAIFMGGMAVGAFLAARYGKRIRNALLAYAVVEALIGVSALAFHPIYLASVEYAYNTLFPTLNPSTILWAKWSLAAALIIPQSILLGSTFPFMSSGILRRFPELPGKSLAFLYFNNSFGAAIGVLLSGYWFIPQFGLPITMLIAGCTNLILAVSVAILSRDDARSLDQSSLLTPSKERNNSSLLLMLTIAAFTGAASFMYEIGWIRMLSMVLGSTTHAFELMLSAFILGLALGGFIVRRFIDKLSSPIIALAFIQLAMGVLAAATLIVYNSLFHVMGFTVNNLANTAANYWWFNIICHGLALLIMLPATICAGMTLPLITYNLIINKQGESAIGNIYAANTIGAIIGIVLSIQWLMPSFGLKPLILVGAGIDIALGLFLLRTALDKPLRFLPKFAVPRYLAITTFVFIAAFVHLDPLAMASGIYTTGEIKRNREMIYMKDGKTASISFFRNDDYLAVATNGKTEAAISSEELAKDEPTMILLGMLPLSIKPEAKTVATIGIGSGLTTHSLLLSPNLKQVDTIEIEPAMVEAAKLFGDRVSNTFTDPRSKIHIEDAKAYFTNQSSNYDIIISEPSNPWISGVAGLFSKEFYQHTQRYLNDDGLLVQWIHLYHIDLPQIASVMKALSPQFSDYRIYALNLSDIAIVATQTGKVPTLNNSLFKTEAMRKQLNSLGIRSLSDLQIRDLGSKSSLDPFFNSFSAPANSDFAPYLDYSAARARFLQASATPLLDLAYIPKAMKTFVEVEGETLPNAPLGENHHLPIGIAAQTAQNLAMENIFNLFPVCENREQALSWIQKVHNYADQLLPYYANNESALVWQTLARHSCLQYLSFVSENWVFLYEALDKGDARAVITSARQLFTENKHPENLGEQFIVASLLSAYNQLGLEEEKKELINSIDVNQDMSVALRFILSQIQ